METEEHIMEGWLTKKSGILKAKFWFQLIKDKLTYSKSKAAMADSASKCTTVDLAGVHQVRRVTSPLSFEIVSRKEHLVLGAATQVECDEWVKALQVCMQYHRRSGWLAQSSSRSDSLPCAGSIDAASSTISEADVTAPVSNAQPTVSGGSSRQVTRQKKLANDDEEIKIDGDGGVPILSEGGAGSLTEQSHQATDTIGINASVELTVRTATKRRVAAPLYEEVLLDGESLSSVRRSNLSEATICPDLTEPPCQVPVISGAQRPAEDELAATYSTVTPRRRTQASLDVLPNAEENQPSICVTISESGSDGQEVDQWDYDVSAIVDALLPSDDSVHVMFVPQSFDPEQYSQAFTALHEHLLNNVGPEKWPAPRQLLFGAQIEKLKAFLVSNDL